MRCEKSKYTTVKALQSIGYDTIASGDSHNDLGMIQASKAGFLFKSTDAIKAEYPNIPAYETYDELFAAIKKLSRDNGIEMRINKEAVAWMKIRCAQLLFVVSFFTIHVLGERV